MGVRERQRSQSITDPGTIRPAIAGQRRPRLHYVYYALAAFDLVTVTLGLLLIFWITSRFERSVEINSRWADRLAEIWALSEQASAVVAPANNIFDASRDAAAEHEVFVAARDRFMERLDILPPMPEGSPVDRSALRDAAASMISEAERIFVDYEHGNTSVAGSRMAAMDRAHYQLTGELARIAAIVRGIQRQLLAEQQAAADSVRRFEFLIAGLIVCMVIGVTVYGHRLARQMKESSSELARYRDELEDLVHDRTVALEASHQRLRVSERLASIGTMAAGLGHDMSNVLFPIKCRLDALEEAIDESLIEQQIQPVRQSIGYLQSLSDGLRLLSTNPLDLDATAATTDLSAWLPDVQSLLGTVLPKHATLSFDLPESLPDIAIPPHSLTQAVFNLAANAGEAIGPDGTVRIAAERSDDERFIDITVTDNGSGMTEEVLAHALEPFYTTKKRGLSTGLGMALVQGICRKVGGHLDIESAPRRGTAVTLTLPVAAAGVRAAAMAAYSACVSIDDQRVASLIRSLLGAAGFELVESESPGPPSGVALWVTEPTDVALLEAGRPSGERATPRMIVYGGAPLDGMDAATTVFVDPQRGVAELQHAITSLTPEAGHA